MIKRRARTKEQQQQQHGIRSLGGREEEEEEDGGGEEVAVLIAQRKKKRVNLDHHREGGAVMVMASAMAASASSSSSVSYSREVMEEMKSESLANKAPIDLDDFDDARVKATTAAVTQAVTAGTASYSKQILEELKRESMMPKSVDEDEFPVFVMEEDEEEEKKNHDSFAAGDSFISLDSRANNGRKQKRPPSPPARKKKSEVLVSDMEEDDSVLRYAKRMAENESNEDPAFAQRFKEAASLSNLEGIVRNQISTEVAEHQVIRDSLRAKMASLQSLPASLESENTLSVRLDLIRSKYTGIKEFRRYVKGLCSFLAVLEEESLKDNDQHIDLFDDIREEYGSLEAVLNSFAKFRAGFPTEFDSTNASLTLPRLLFPYVVYQISKFSDTDTLGTNIQEKVINPIVSFDRNVFEALVKNQILPWCNDKSKNETERGKAEVLRQMVSSSSSKQVAY